MRATDSRRRNRASRVDSILRALIEQSEGRIPRSLALKVAETYVDHDAQQALVVLNAAGWEFFHYYTEKGESRVRVVKKLTAKAQ